MLSLINKIFLFLLLFILLSGFASPVYAVRFNAYWLYRQSGGEEVNTRQEFQQRYTMGVGKGLTFQPTHAIRATAGVGYTRTHRDIGKGLTASESLIPTGQLGLVNDIFLAHLSGTTSTIHEGPARTKSWNATLGSSWNIPLLPTMRFTYNENIANITLKDKSTSMSVNWNLILADFSYQYNNVQNVNNNISLAENSSHFARFETGGMFWDKRISFNLAQNFGYAIQNINIENSEDTSIDPAEVGFFDSPLERQATPGKIDLETDPNPTDPDYVYPEDIQDLRDTDTDTPALNVDPGERIHLGISLLSSQPIGFIRLSLIDSLLPAEKIEELEWDIYVRDSSNTVWVRVVESRLGTFDEDENRIEILINRTEPEIMVVAVNNTGLPLNFTETEAFTRITENFSSRNTSYLTNLGLRYRVTRTLRASVNMNLEQSENESGDNAFENSRRAVSGRLSWTPVAFVRPSLGFSETREEQTMAPEQISRSYSLTVSTIPLKSMNVILGATRSERYSGEQKTYSGNRYNLITSAQIYPDLTASWLLGYGESETIDTDGFLTPNPSTFNSRLVLSAKLQQALKFDISSSYRRSEKETGTTEDADAVLGLQYRPSALLALRGSYITKLLGTETPDSLSLALSLVLLRTEKANLSLNLNHSQANETSDSLALKGSWDISNKLSMQARSNLSIGKSPIYSFQATMTLRL